MQVLKHIFSPFDHYDAREVLRTSIYDCKTNVTALAVVIGSFSTYMLGTTAGAITTVSVYFSIAALCKKRRLAVQASWKPEVHNPITWLQDFAVQSAIPQKKRAMLADVFSATKRAAVAGFVVNPGTLTVFFQAPKRINLDRAKILKAQKSAVAFSRLKSVDKVEAIVLETQVAVYNADSLDIARQLQNAGHKPAVLNMANLYEAGGGVTLGSSAQEEELFRRSNYNSILNPNENPKLRGWFWGTVYPFSRFGTIYTPGVTVFRSGKKEGYAFVEPYTVDLIACAAFDKAKDRPSNQNDYKVGFKTKIQAILRTGIRQKNDSIVLGAFGCGAFGNDPKIVANLFKEVIAEPEFKGKYREIAFAIINDENGRSNYEIFRNALRS